MQTQQNPRVLRAAWFMRAAAYMRTAGLLNAPASPEAPSGLVRLAVVGFAVMTALTFGGKDALAQYSISQQGRLLSSGGFAVPDGPHQFTIKFYTVQVAGTAVLSYVVPSISVVKGVFTVPMNVAAADMTTLASSLPSWVGVTIDTDAELPRIALRDVPFALFARKAFGLTCVGCVGTNEITDASITNTDLNSALVFDAITPGTGATGTAFNTTQGNNVLKFAAGTNATIALDNVNHVVTIGATTQGQVTQVATGAGLTGGPINSTTPSGTISVATGGVTNAMLQNSTITVAPGTGTSVTGSPVALGGTVTVNNTGVITVAATPPLASSGGQNPTVSIAAGTAAGQTIHWSGAAWSSAFVDASELTGVLAVAKGGTGPGTSPTVAGQYLRSSAAGTWALQTGIPAGDLPSLTGTYVDLVNAQTAGGIKTWSALANFAAGIALTNATSNKIAFGAAGVGPPTFTTTSAGAKIVHYPSISGTLVDYSEGVESGPPASLWYAVPAATASYAHKWYGGTTQLMLLKGDGTLTVAGNVSAPTFVGSFSGNGSAITAINPANIAAGTAGISISGNAATATTATNATNATTATNATNANYATNAGNANTVTNGVYTTGNYGDSLGNLGFISTVSAAKITGTVASAATATTATTATNFSGALSGDVTGNQTTTYVGKIANVPATSAGVATGMVLKYNGSQWAPGTDISTGGGDVQGSGSGSANYLAKWTNGTTLTSGMINDNGSVAAIGGNGYMQFGPNGSWGAYLVVGGNGHVTNNATVTTTNGNLHLDSAPANNLYLNYYANTDVYTGTGNLRFGSANPYLYSAGSYFVIPYGAYFNGGTVYVTNPIQARGGVQNDSGDLQLNDNVDATGNGTTATDYTNAPIEVRQNSTYPRISFHWPGVVASQIGMDSAGTLRTFNNPGSGYENFAANNVTAYGSVRGRGTSYGWRLGSSAGDGVSGANSWLYLMRDDGGATYHDLALGSVYVSGNLYSPGGADYSGNRMWWFWGEYESGDRIQRRWSLNYVAPQIRNPWNTDGVGRSIAGSIQIGQSGCGCSDANRGVMEWRDGGGGNDTLWICMKVPQSGWGVEAVSYWRQIM